MVKKSMFSKVLPYVFGASMLVSTNLIAQNNYSSTNKPFMITFEKPFSHKSFETKINYNWRDNILTSSKNNLLTDKLTINSGDDITTQYFDLNHNLNLEQTAKELSTDVRMKIAIGNKRYFDINSSVIAPNYYPGIAFSVYKK